MTSVVISPRPYFLWIEVGYLPPMNTSATRRHWSVAHREVKRWRAIVATYRPKPSQPLLYARVTCVRMSTREPDYENLTMSFKAAVDSLVHCGIVVDDSPAHMERIYRWAKARPRCGRVAIRVEEIA